MQISSLRLPSQLQLVLPSTGRITAVKGIKSHHLTLQYFSDSRSMHKISYKKALMILIVRYF